MRLRTAGVSTAIGTMVGMPRRLMASHPRFARLLVIVALLAVVAISTAGRPLSAADSPSTELVSVDSTGAQVAISSLSPSISADGLLVAFWAADDLSGDGGRGIHLLDRSTGTMTYVADGQSPQLSADGSVILFISRDDGLVSGDVNGSGVDAFVWTRQTGAIELVTIAPDGTQMTEFRTGMTARLSSDGTVAVFTGDVVLGPEDEEGLSPRFEVYRRDLASETTTLLPVVGVESPGGGGIDAGALFDVDGDGMKVAYVASNEIASPSANERWTDLYLFEVASGSISRLTHAVDDLRDLSISDDGTRIASVSNLGAVLAFPSPPSGTVEVFVHDVPSGEAFPVDTNSPGHERAQISPDGRWVAYLTAAALDTADTNGTADWYVKDTFTTQTVERLTVASGGGVGTGFGSTEDVIGFSGDGSVVAFSTGLNGLVAGDVDGFDDVFVRVRGDITGPEITALSIQPNGAPVGEAVQIDATADDTNHPQFSDIASIDYSIDGGPYVAMNPADGAFDSPVESGRISNDAIAGGSHQICVRGRDSTGRVGLASCQPLEVSVERWPLTVRILSVEDLTGGLDPLGNPPDFYVRAQIGKLLIPVDLTDNRAGTADNQSLIDPGWEYTVDVRADRDPAIVILEVWDDDTLLNLADDKADAVPGPGDQVIFSVDLGTGEISRFPFGRGACSSGDDATRAVRICYEVELGRDLDPDGDAIPTEWETIGYDADGDGAIDVDLAVLGADPMRKDIFVEIDCVFSDGRGDGDYTDDQDHNHCPTQPAVMAAVQAFADAPVDNPDGTTGVQLHVDTGTLYGPGVTQVPASSGGVAGSFGDLGGGGGDQIDEVGNEIIEFRWVNQDWIGDGSAADFYDLKNTYFNVNRDPVFHYSIWGHQTNLRKRLNDCTSGLAERFASSIGTRDERVADDFLVTMGGWRDINNIDPCRRSGTDANGFPTGTDAQQTGTFLHELGHNLGLGHGGGSDEIHGKPNYLSAMNYAYQSCATNGLLVLAQGQCGYSIVDHDLDESSLDECVGIDDPKGEVGLGLIDWNGNGMAEGVTCASTDALKNGWRTQNIAFDINGDNVCVEAGVDGVIGSTPTGDDALYRQPGGDIVIADGSDRVCDTLPDPLTDDTKAKYANREHPAFLSGYEDWSNLIFNYRIGLNFEVSADVASTDPDELEDVQAFLAALTRPEVTVEANAPVTANEGSVITYELHLSNEGRGPALGVEVEAILPNGTIQTRSVAVVALGGDEHVSFDWFAPLGSAGQADARFAVTNSDLSGLMYQLDPVDVATEILAPNLPPEMAVSIDPLIVEGNTIGGWTGDLGPAAAVTASDPDGDSVTLTHDAPALLPLGDTTVTWTADDGHLATTAQQTVTVIDTTRPIIDPVADIQTITNDPLGTVVEFTKPLATDTVDPAPLVGCAPPSTSAFAVGITNVTCTATDQSGNAATTTFEVEVISGGGPVCTIVGTDGDDILFGTRGDDVICGFAGNDVIFGGRGSDRLYGGEGYDALFGGPDPDILYGEEGNDVLYGGRGDDHLEGGPSWDLLIGGPGNDTMIQ